MRLFAFVSVLLVLMGGLFGWLWLGYTRTNAAKAEEGLYQVTFDAYVISWAGSLAGGGAAGSGAALEDMFPITPEGWTRRAVSDADRTALQGKGMRERHRLLVLDAATSAEGEGVEQASIAWDSPKGPLIAELVRLPDAFFIHPEGEAMRAARADDFAEVQKRPFLYIAGLEIFEADLPPQVPTRVLMAELEQQISLRVSAPRAMTDAELRDFFTSLNVAAMNDALFAPLEGMGRAQPGAPKIAALLALLTDEERASIAADTARFAQAREILRAESAEYRAGLSAEEMTAAALIIGAQVASDESGKVTVKRGIKKKDSGRSTIRTTGKKQGKQQDCSKVGGRKVCGVAAPQAE